MFAALGEIQFEVVGSPEGYESAGAYDFAEQRVIESKPRLQWVGDDLERLEHVVLAEFRNNIEAERTARTASLQLEMKAIRQIVRYLRPERPGAFEDGGRP